MNCEILRNRRDMSVICRKLLCGMDGAYDGNVIVVTMATLFDYGDHYERSCNYWHGMDLWCS